MIESNYKGKNILLAITQDMNIYKCMKDNLNSLGFSTHVITNSYHFKYKNLKDKIYNTYRKVILSDKEYKKKLIERQKTNSIKNQIDQMVQIDYTLTIRADLFEESIIEKITNKSQNNFAYQWDGLNRFPNIKDRINYFKKFYVFDKQDLNIEYTTYLTTNFYFDCYTDVLNKNPIEYDVFFIGTLDNRIDKLITICEKLKNIGLKLHILLCGTTCDKLKKYDYLTFLNTPTDYYDNLIKLSKSKIIIDLSHDNLHSGLSLRIFESIGYDKKLITTNEIVRNYDFYDPNNIFIFDNKNSNDLENFIKIQYKALDPKTKYKYSFTNWINYILDNKDAIKLDTL